jgi:regulator of protease activity HflC (stomatin/prohibitin superfamily)
MSTPEKIAANHANAQLSTGPVTPEGKRTSSRNATKHGFTGLSLVVSEPEREAYEAHVAAYLSSYNPTTHQQNLLVHQLADLDWSLHQINVQQINLFSLMNQCQIQLAGDHDPLATTQVMAQHAQTLNTLNLYEQRRRRAAKAVAQDLQALIQAEEEKEAKELAMAAAAYKIHQAEGKTFNPAEFGFVCSLTEIEQYILGQKAAESAPRIPSPAELEAILRKFAC